MFVFQTGLEQIWPRVPIHSRSICQSEAAAEISMNIFQMQEKKCKRDILRICKEAKKMSDLLLGEGDQFLDADDLFCKNWNYFCNFFWSWVLIWSFCFMLKLSTFCSNKPNWFPACSFSNWLCKCKIRLRVKIYKGRVLFCFLVTPLNPQFSVQQKDRQVKRGPRRFPSVPTSHSLTTLPRGTKTHSPQFKLTPLLPFLSSILESFYHQPATCTKWHLIWWRKEI